MYIPLQDQDRVTAALIKNYWYNVVPGTFESEGGFARFDYLGSTKLSPRPVCTMHISADLIEGVQTA